MYIFILTAMQRAERRIEKELEKFSESDEGLTVAVISTMQWRVSFSGPPPLYTGERMTLRVTFGKCHVPPCHRATVLPASCFIIDI